MKHPKSFDSDDATRKRMSHVKLKAGNAEVLLAKELYKRGYRYWKNYKKLPGSPDIAIRKYNIAVFVDGEFWHGYDWLRRKENIVRNKEYWLEKIEENIARDIRNDKKLKEIGWIPVHFWTKEVLSNPIECVNDIEDLVIQLKSQN